jgi:hypothetical protein
MFETQRTYNNSHKAENLRIALDSVHDIYVLNLIEKRNKKTFVTPLVVDFLHQEQNYQLEWCPVHLKIKMEILSSFYLDILLYATYC